MASSFWTRSWMLAIATTTFAAGPAVAERGVLAPPQTAAMPGQAITPAATMQVAEGNDRSRTPIVPAAWNLRASALIGMDVRDVQNQSIGQIKELVVDLRGDIQAVVVSVGGFLGLGDHSAAVSWKELQFNREQGRLAATVSMSRDQLKALPEYKLPKR